MEVTVWRSNGDDSLELGWRWEMEGSTVKLHVAVTRGRMSTMYGRMEAGRCTPDMTYDWNCERIEGLNIINPYVGTNTLGCTHWNSTPRLVSEVEERRRFFT